VWGEKVGEQVVGTEMKEDDEEAAYFRDEFEEREEHTADDDESEARITRLERMPLPQQQKSVWEKDPLRFRYRTLVLAAKPCSHNQSLMEKACMLATCC
jgi:hypothetical protein